MNALGIVPIRYLNSASLIASGVTRSARAWRSLGSMPRQGSKADVPERKFPRVRQGISPWGK